MLNLLLNRIKIKYSLDRIVINQKGNFMNWYFEVLKNYAEFNGRAGRKEYWYYTLFNTIAIIILVVIDAVTGSINENIGLGFLSGIYILAVLIPNIGVTIRRLHDTNRSGWWCLVALIPIIGSLALIVFMVLAGTSGGNQYGSDPKINEPSIPAGMRSANATPQQTDKFIQLEKLKQLLDQGILTEEEFKIEKQKVLDI